MRMQDRNEKDTRTKRKKKKDYFSQQNRMNSRKLVGISGKDICLMVCVSKADSFLFNLLLFESLD